MQDSFFAQRRCQISLAASGPAGRFSKEQAALAQIPSAYREHLSRELRAYYIAMQQIPHSPPVVWRVLRPASGSAACQTRGASARLVLERLPAKSCCIMSGWNYRRRSRLPRLRKRPEELRGCELMATLLRLSSCTRSRLLLADFSVCSSIGDIYFGPSGLSRLVDVPGSN